MWLAVGDAWSEIAGDAPVATVSNRKEAHDGEEERVGNAPLARVSSTKETRDVESGQHTRASVASNRKRASERM